MVRICRIAGPEFEADERICACIGYFDGMHKGHQALIKRTIEEAEKTETVPAMIYFDPDPYEVINQKKTGHLFSCEERIRLAEHFGIEKIVEIAFDEKLMRMSPAGFITEYLERLMIDRLICGFDFHFGYEGKGDGRLLREKASFETIVIPEQTCNSEKISTSRIKEAVRRGDFRLAEELLGFPYYFMVRVDKAERSGSKWLLETKAADEGCIVPEDGEYESIITVRDGKIFIIKNEYHEPGEVLKVEI